MNKRLTMYTYAQLFKITKIICNFSLLCVKELSKICWAFTKLGLKVFTTSLIYLKQRKAMR